MPEKKTCPLNHLPCKEKCAWWDEDAQECAILALARAAKKVIKNVR